MTCRRHTFLFREFGGERLQERNALGNSCSEIGSDISCSSVLPFGSKIATSTAQTLPVSRVSANRALAPR